MSGMPSPLKSATASCPTPYCSSESGQTSCRRYSVRNRRRAMARCCSCRRQSSRRANQVGYPSPFTSQRTSLICRHPRHGYQAEVAIAVAGKNAQPGTVISLRGAQPEANAASTLPSPLKSPTSNWGKTQHPSSLLSIMIAGPAVKLPAPFPNSTCSSLSPLSPSGLVSNRRSNLPSCSRLRRAGYRACEKGDGASTAEGAVAVPEIHVIPAIRSSCRLR